MESKLVKSYEEACEHLGIEDSSKVLPDVSAMLAEDQKAITAYAKLCIIQRALNGEWVPDYRNVNEGKYYPWFYVNIKEGTDSGFGLLCSVYDFGGGSTFFGARLVYWDAKTARYAGVTFLELYEDMVLTPKAIVHEEIGNNTQLHAWSTIT